MFRSFTRIFVATCCGIALFALPAFAQQNRSNLTSGNTSTEAAHWPQWRGPSFNGMAKSDAPTHWSDTQNIKWKLDIPGRGFSTPVVWGEKLFLTTAVPTGKTRAGTSNSPHPNGGAGANQEHKFVVLCIDRHTGKLLWEQTAKVTTPHEG